MIKTFRGLLAAGGQDRIRLQTIKGKMGYKVIKFEVIDKTPGTDTLECVVKIYKELQSTIDGVINFTDSALLASAYFGQTVSQYSNLEKVTVFDNEIFNQDIYITSYDNTGNNESINYYVELEVIPLDDAGAEYTTLKDMRSS